MGNVPPIIGHRRQSDEWLFGLFEHEPLLCTHTLDGFFLSVNGAAARALRYTESELVGRRLSDILDPETRGLLAEYLQRVRFDREAMGLMRVRTADDEQRVWLYRNTLVEADGHDAYVMGQAWDVTDLRHAHHLELEHRALIQNAAYGIYRANVDGTLLLVNPALVRLLGYASEEELMAVNLRTDVFTDPSAIAQFQAVYGDTEEIEEFEADWKRSDGSLITVSLSGRAVRDSAGKLECLEIFVRDVSEQRALEMQLKHAQRMELVGQLTGGMAHDFNNILTVILANANLIRAALPETAETMRADLDELEAAARRGTAMVKRLLGFSRRVRLPQQPVDLYALSHDLVGTLRRLLPESIQIDLQAVAELPKVRADLGAVEQIVINLATNARDAMPRGGTFTIDIAPVTWDEGHRAEYGWGDPGDYVRLSAIDTGEGMAPEIREKAFEPFFTTKAPGQGTGLGMPMIYGLIKQHGGFVDLESTPGKGTSVHVFFPAMWEHVQTPATSEDNTELTGGTETILLVEDEEPIRRAGKRVLERFGYQVRLASDGEEALRFFGDAAEPIHLVITDVMMPKVNGAELYETLTQKHPGVKFLFMSGYTQDDLREAIAFDLNVPWVQKPWSPVELLVQVREVLDGAATKTT